LSYSRLKFTLLNMMTAESVNGIKLFDVSVNQQRDSASCGLFALENARVINRALEDGHIDLDSVRARLEDNHIDTNILRREYSRIMDGALPDFVAESHDEETGAPVRESVEDAKVEAEEEAEGILVGPIHDELLRQEEEEGEESAPTVNRALADWRSKKTAIALKEFIRSVTDSGHSFESPFLPDILAGAKVMRTSANFDQRDMEDVFHFILDFIEEQDDPWAYTVANLPSPELLEALADLSDSIFGMDHIITTKLWMMAIFNNVDPFFTVRQFLTNGGRGQNIKNLFAVGVPRPQTGTSVDTNMDEDIIREIRYLYGAGMVLHSENDLYIARRVFRKALNWSISRAYEGLFLFRRGHKALVDMMSVRSSIRLNLALVYQDMGDDASAMALLSQSASDELLCPAIQPTLSQGYRNYLMTIVLYPSFTPDDLTRVLQSNTPIGAKYALIFSTMIRAKAMIWGKSEEPQKSLSLIHVALQHLEDHYLNLHNLGEEESSFDGIMENAIHQLYETRYMVKKYFLKDLSANEMLAAKIELIEAFVTLCADNFHEVYDQCLLDVVSSLSVRSLTIHLSENDTMGESDSYTWEAFDTAMQSLCNDRGDDIFDHYPSFEPYMASIYESRARTMFYRGQLRDFVWFMMLSLFSEKQFGMNHSRDDNLEGEMVNIMERSSVTTLLASNYEEFYFVYVDTMNYFRLPMSGQIEYQEGEYRRGEVVPLMRLSFRAASDGVRRRMLLIRQILFQPEVEQSFVYLTTFL
jgi:hypothetical protein